MAVPKFHLLPHPTAGDARLCKVKPDNANGDFHD
jgi:hypothetical protein